MSGYTYDLDNRTSLFIQIDIFVDKTSLKRQNTVSTTLKFWVEENAYW